MIVKMKLGAGAAAASGKKRAAETLFPSRRLSSVRDTCPRCDKGFYLIKESLFFDVYYAFN